MPRFAANLTMMYNEYPFMDRFAAAAKDGFAAVEYMFPYDFPAEEIAHRLKDNGLKQALFNVSAGDWAGGERGLAVLPGREADFRRSVDQALTYAKVIGNDRLHVMAGNRLSWMARERQLAVYKNNIAYAADKAAEIGITIVIEPINRRDIPAYFLSHQDEAHAICIELGRPNLKVMFDVYHCQIMDGDIAMRLRRDLAGIGHIQIAGVPDRHEPDDRGELNYPYLFSLIDELGYQGWIGCEYRPAATTSAGLGWFKSWKGHQ